MQDSANIPETTPTPAVAEVASARILPSSEYASKYLTKEMAEEVYDTFQTVSYLPNQMQPSKLSLALRALGMEATTDEMAMYQSVDGEGSNISSELFTRIVAHQLMLHPHWAVREMAEVFGMFDRDGHGFVVASEMRKLFSKYGETLEQVEAEDQLREFDIDGDAQMVIGEFQQMVAKTKGSDFVFDN